MSKLKFFTDVHIDKAVAIQLQQRGIDVLRCVDIGMKAAEDSELLEYATENGYAFISMDTDVTRLHSEWTAKGKTHCGIFHAPMSKFRGKAGVGPIVRTCAEFAELIEQDAGTLEEDVHNQIHYIKAEV